MKIENTKLKAVIFDMDGVITNTMPYHYKAWRRTLKQQGIMVDKFEIYHREGQPGISTVKEIFANCGKKITKLQARKILQRKEELFKAIVKTKFIRGAINCLKRFKINGLKLALVTGTARHEAKKILPPNIYNLFDAIVTGDEVRLGKPNPEPYLKIMKKLKMQGSDVIVIENAPFGIASAKSAGLKCIALATSLPEKYLKGADIILTSFSEFKRKLNISQDYLCRNSQEK